MRFWISALVLVLGACAYNPPDWFLHPKLSDETFYGFGSGESLAKAKQEAINDLAQNIQITISSSTNLQNRLQKDVLSSSFSQDIDINVAALDLQNLQITKRDYVNKTYYIRVDINKKDILAPLIADYKAKAELLKTIQTSCESITLRDFALLQKELKQIHNLAALIHIIDPPSIAKLPNVSQAKLLLAANLPMPKINISFQGNVALSDLNPISMEIAQFFQITNKNNTHKLIATINLKKLSSEFEVIANFIIKDCSGNVLFQSSIQERQRTRENAIKRTGIVLYKKLLEYQAGGDNNAIPKIN